MAELVERVEEEWVSEMLHPEQADPESLVKAMREELVRILLALLLLPAEEGEELEEQDRMHLLAREEMVEVE
jgi:hypothetical protein